MESINYLVTYDEGESLEEYSELIDAYKRFDALKSYKVSCQIWGWDERALHYKLMDEYTSPEEAFESPYKLVDDLGGVKGYHSYEEAAKSIEGLMKAGIKSELNVWDWMKGKYKPLIVFNPNPSLLL